MFFPSRLGSVAKYLAPVSMMLALVAAHGDTLPTDYLTYEGVWTTVPLTGLTHPTAVTGDTAGNLYVTDGGVSSVVKLAADGVTQTTLGNGLDSPDGVAVDSSGNVYVTSNGDNKVYKITSGGTQTAIGSGWNAPVSVAVDSNGNVFVTDSSGLSKLTSGGSQSVLVSGSSLRGVAVDTSNNVYYGDNTSQHVFEVPGGTGSPTQLNSAPFVQSLYVDATGKVYSAQTSTGVYRADDNSGDFTLFGDTSASYGVWGDSHQNLYIADHSGTIEKLAMGPVDFGSVNLCPTGATVTPCSSSQVLHFALDSLVSATAATQAVTQGPTGLDFATDGGCNGDLAPGGSCTVTVTFAPLAPGLRMGAVEAVGSSEYNSFAPPVGPRPRSSPTVRPRDQPDGTLLSLARLHGIGIAPVGVFSTAPIVSLTGYLLPDAYPVSVLFGSYIDAYVVDENNCVVQRIADGIQTLIGTTCGPAAGDGGPANAATLQMPWGIALDGAGNLYISDTDAHTIRRGDALSENITTYAGTGTSSNTGDGGPATSATFIKPEGLAIDYAGNLYVADFGADVVRRIDAVTGIITTFAGNGSAGETGDGGAATSAELDGPDALAIDKDGNLYIADDTGNVIRKVAAGTNVITTIAGTGTAGYSGDGGPATSAAINDPEGLSVDAAGNLYIADSSNYLVRKVNVTTGIITTVAGAYNSSGTETYTGDGGPATLAGMSYVQDAAVYYDGEILVADSDNGVLRLVVAPQGLGSFGNVALGSSSAPQDTTFSNIGTSSLVTSALQVPADFSIGGADTTCTSTTTLAPGAGCVLGLTFVPTTDGDLTETITIADNEGNNPAATQSITVSGTGTGIAPAQLAFMGAIAPIAAGGNPGTVTVAVEDSGSNVLTSATSAVTLTITGPGGYSYSVTVSATSGLASFNLGSLVLTTPGTYTLTATSAGLTQATASLTVTGVPAATPVLLAIASSVPATIGAGGSPGVVVVNLENSAGAVVTSATNEVQLTLTGPGGYSYSATVAAVAGVASFDFSALSLTAPGTYTLTATCGNLTQAVATFTITVDFTIAFTSGSSTTANVAPGGTALYGFTLAPATTSFSSPITLTASGLPAGATYSFSPATVTPGSSPVATVLTIQTVRTTSAGMREVTGWGTSILFCMLLLPVSASRRMRRAFRRGRMLSIAAALIVLGSVAGLTGCGAGGLFGQAQQTYTITVTGTSGSLSHSATVTLTVQ